MTTELVAALGLIAASAISGVAAVFAAKAEKNSRPVSNGFVPELRHDVKELRALLLDHLKEHSKG